MARKASTTNEPEAVVAASAPGPAAATVAVEAVADAASPTRVRGRRGYTQVTTSKKRVIWVKDVDLVLANHLDGAASDDTVSLYARRFSQMLAKRIREGWPVTPQENATARAIVKKRELALARAAAANPSVH